MTDTIRTRTDLLYFTHSVDGGIYGGWYRLLPAGCIEVLSVGLMRTIPLDGRGALEVAREALDEFVRTRKRLGQPIPPLPGPHHNKY